MTTTAILDACVIIPAPLNATLLRAAQAGLYRVLWSDEILEEARRNLVESGLTDEPGARRRIAAMRAAFPDALVTGYQPMTQQLPIDAKDRHVLAAAVVGGAPEIVTFNLRHFPRSALSPFGIAAISPDGFLSRLLAERPKVMLEVIVRQAAALRNPPHTPREVLAGIGLHAPRFAAQAQELLDKAAPGA
jgi:hypothetical protein